MTNPATKPGKRRSQIFDDHEARMKAALESLKKKNRSFKKLVAKLSSHVIRKVTGKK